VGSGLEGVKLGTNVKSRRPDDERSWRQKVYEIVFEADTPAGVLFDVVLLGAIFLSVMVVMLESVESIRLRYGPLLVGAEWFFTVLFTLEYGVRIACAPRPVRYIFSFYGIVDLLAILPTYLIALPIMTDAETQRLTTIRALRLLRAFRIFKLAHMLSEAEALRSAIWAARAKVAVFLSFVVISVVIVGSAMHLIEGGRVDEQGQAASSGFDSIPASMYWAVVTMTTVGYGDVSPSTALGKGLAACMMLLGYCMIIVPTSIVSAEFAQAAKKSLTVRVCENCMAEGHEADARYCKYCGTML